MSAVHLYCQGACAACSALRHTPDAHDVDVETHDVTTNPRAYDTVIALGYRSLPVLVGHDGTAAAGAGAGELTRRLSSRVEAPVDTNHGRVHDPMPAAVPDPGAETQTLVDHGGAGRRTRHLASDVSCPNVSITATGRKDQS